MLILVIIIVVGYNWLTSDGKKHQNKGRPVQATYAAPRTAAAPSFQTKPAISAAAKNNDGLVTAVGHDYKVPPGAISGVWHVESGALPGGYHPKWRSAAALAMPGSECYRTYAQKDPGFCERQWRALQAICNQRRNGTPICDPKDVKTSEAFAMGPAQLLPTTILSVNRDGIITWNRAVAVDYDHDGVVDPHSLPDALAMAARHLRNRFDLKPNLPESQRWMFAVSSYYGKQNSGYYEGLISQKDDARVRYGVQQYWQAWCDWHGCKAPLGQQQG